MEFDIILVTRNRQAVLEISIPLMLTQSRQPKNFIVVDASDQHNAVNNSVGEIFKNNSNGINYKIVRAEAGISQQRNVGLCYAKSEIVFFPDDDSIWFSGVAEKIMEIYEKDHGKKIGAVCAAESLVPPGGFYEQNKDKIYRKEFRDGMAPYLNTIIGSVEERYFPDPLLLWDHLTAEASAPKWLIDYDAELCGPMTGFRMTFRTEVIKKYLFDESLGKYSLFEDRDASKMVLRNHFIAVARNAKVFHYRVPGPRTSGLEFGMMHIMNRVYVARKHMPKDPRSERIIKRYLYYKLLRYLLQTFTSYGRQRFWGGVKAMPYAMQLINASDENIQELYIKLRKKYFEKVKGAENSRQH